MTCLFLPRSLCCSWYSRLTLSISSHFSQQPVKLTKFLARISFSCRTLRSSMSSRQLRSDREALRMVTAASSGFQFRDKGKQRKRNQTTVGIILTTNSTVNMLRFSWVFIVWTCEISYLSWWHREVLNGLTVNNIVRSKIGRYIPHEHNPYITHWSPYPLSRMNLPGLSPEHQALNWWHVWEGWGIQVEQSHPLRSRMEWRGRGHH